MLHLQDPLGLAVVALCSSSAFNFKPEALGITELLMSWGEHVAGWSALKGCPLLVLRYEDLLADAEERAPDRRIPGQPTVRNRVTEVVAATSFEQLSGQESERGFTEAVRSGGFFRVGTADQWREVKDQGVFRRSSTDLPRPMRRYGYLERGAERPAVGAARPGPPH